RPLPRRQRTQALPRRRRAPPHHLHHGSRGRRLGHNPAPRRRLTAERSIVIASNPGPAVHLALIGAVIVIALIVYAIVRVRRRREAAAAEQLNQLDDLGPPTTSGGHEDQ